VRGWSAADRAAAALLLQQGEWVVYVKEQLGHGSIQITADTYGHLIPGANRGAVNRLADDAATQLSATQAQSDRASTRSTVVMMRNC
jgi:integrase